MARGRAPTLRLPLPHGSEQEAGQGLLGRLQRTSKAQEAQTWPPKEEGTTSAGQTEEGEPAQGDALPVPDLQAWGAGRQGAPAHHRGRAEDAGRGLLPLPGLRRAPPLHRGDVRALRLEHGLPRVGRGAQTGPPRQSRIPGNPWYEAGARGSVQ